MSDYDRFVRSLVPATLLAWSLAGCSLVVDVPGGCPDVQLQVDGLTFGADDRIAAVTSRDCTVFVCGAISGTFDRGDGSDLPGAGKTDVLVAQLVGDQLGWARLLGGAEEDACAAIDLGPDGTLAIAGQSQAGFEVDGNDVPDRDGQNMLGDVFVATLDAGTGAVRWIETFGSADDDEATDVAVDSRGRVWVGGIADGAPTLPAGELSGGGVGTFLARFDADGATATGFVARGGTTGAVKLAATGEDVVALFVANVDFALSDCAPPTLMGGNDLVLSRLDSELGCVWTDGMLGTGDTIGLDLAIDAGGGNVVVVGATEGRFGFGDNNILRDPTFDAFIARWNVDVGAPRDIEFFGGDGAARFHGVVVDDAGQVAVAGSLTGDVGFGGETFSADSAVADMVVARYTSDNGHLGSRVLGDAAGDERPRGIALAGDRVVVVGEFSGGLDLPLGPVNAVDGFDGFAFADLR